MDEILASHVIDPAALRNDDFETFFSSRERELLDRIEYAMGKPIAGDSLEPDIPEPVEYEEVTN